MDRDPEAVIDDAAWYLLSSYIDGETTLGESESVEERLHSDESYLSAYNSLRATLTATKGIGEIDPPSHLRGSILAATSGRRVSRLATMHRFAVPIGAAAAAAILFAMVRPGLSPRLGMVKPAPVDQQIASSGFDMRGLGGMVKSHSGLRHAPSSVQPNRAATSKSASRSDLAHNDDRTIVEEPIRVADASMTYTTSRRVKLPEGHAIGGRPSNGFKTHAGEKSASGGGAPIMIAQAPGYTPNPMMGNADLRPAAMDTVPDTHQDGQPLRTADDDTSRSDATISTVAEQSPEPQAPRVRFAKMLRSQLASDSTTLLTGVDIKRIRDASMYGFDRPSAESLPHRQTAALVVGRF